MSRALVTGAGGFIGSHLVELLLAEGHEVRALVRYNSRSSRGWLEQVIESDPKRAADLLEVVFGDVTDPFLAARAVDGCEIVHHLAALIGIPYSYAAPASYVAVNVTGTLNLLEAARGAGVRRFLHTSTSEVYGSARRVPIDESHPLQAQSPYAATKIAADKLAESFAASFELPVVVVRPFNTYGPRQSARAVIPTIASQALAGRTVRLGSLDPVRDLTYVTDTARGFLAAARADDDALAHLAEAAGGPDRAINLGTGSSVSIGQLAETILEIVAERQGASPEDWSVQTDPHRVRPQASEVMRLESDNRRAAELLDWRPEVTLRQGLEATVDWIERHQDEFRPGEYAR